MTAAYKARPVGSPSSGRPLPAKRGAVVAVVGAGTVGRAIAGALAGDEARTTAPAGGFELSLASFFSTLRELGPTWTVVTDGKDGAYVSAPSGILHCPALSVPVVGTAGAGDAFSATFAARIAEALPADDAAIAAVANAASVVGHLDTQTGLLRRNDLDARVAALRDTLKLTRWNS